jgi:hypothetical protein
MQNKSIYLSLGVITLTYFMLYTFVLHRRLPDYII